MTELLGHAFEDFSAAQTLGEYIEDAVRKYAEDHNLATSARPSRAAADSSATKGRACPAAASKSAELGSGTAAEAQTPSRQSSDSAADAAESASSKKPVDEGGQHRAEGFASRLWLQVTKKCPDPKLVPHAYLADNEHISSLVPDADTE